MNCFRRTGSPLIPPALPLKLAPSPSAYSGTGQFLPFLGGNVGTWFCGRPMAQEHRSGQIVPESGVYRVAHASAHTGVLLQVRLIKGRRFPICPYCREISFELAHSD